MRWIAPALRFVAVSLGAYALLLAWRGPYTGLTCLLANPLLQFFSGGSGALDWSGAGAVIRIGDSSVNLAAPFLLVAWPLYLGLCAVRPGAPLAHPGRVLAGLGLLLSAQVLASVLLGLRYAWGGGHPALGLVKALGLLLIGGQHVLPLAVWWLQFSSEFWRRPRANAPHP